MCHKSNMCYFVKLSTPNPCELLFEYVCVYPSVWQKYILNLYGTNFFVSHLSIVPGELPRSFSVCKPHFKTKLYLVFMQWFCMIAF